MSLEISDQQVGQLDCVVLTASMHPSYDQSFGRPRAKAIDFQGPVLDGVANYDRPLAERDERGGFSGGESRGGGLSGCFC